MADTAAEGISNLTAHLKKSNSDEEKGREWASKMMQKGDTKQIMWARRTAMGVERIHGMLKAWFADMAKNNNKMREAMLEANRKQDGKGKGKSDTKFGVGGIGMGLLATFAALAAWGTKLQSVLNILYAGRWLRMFTNFGKFFSKRLPKLIQLRIFDRISGIFRAIGEIWKKRGTMQFLKGETLKALGRFVRPIEVLFLWIARAEKWIKGLKIWTYLKPAQKGIGAIGGFFARMGTFFKGVMTFLTPAINFLKGTGQVISKGFGAIGRFFSGIAKFIMPLLGVITKALPFLKAIPVVGWIITAIMGIFDYIKGFIAGWTGADADAGFIEKLLAGMWGGIKGLLIGLIAKPLDLLKDGISWILEKMGFDKMSAALDKFSFEKLFGDLFGWIEGTFKKISDWFALLFTDPVAAVKELMPEWILDFGNWLKTKIWDPITASWDEFIGDPKAALLSLIPQWMKDFGTWIGNKIIKPVTDWFDSLFGGDKKESAFMAAFKKKWDAIKDFGGMVYRKFIKPVVDWVDSLFGGGDKKDAGKKVDGGSMFKGFDIKIPSMDEMIGKVMGNVAAAIRYIGDLALKNLPGTLSIDKKVSKLFFDAADYVAGLGQSGSSGTDGGSVSGAPTGSGTGAAAGATEGGNADVANVKIVGGGGGGTNVSIDNSQQNQVNSKAGGGRKPVQPPKLTNDSSRN